MKDRGFRPDNKWFNGRLAPNNKWFEGEVFSWEDHTYGYRSVFEVINDPANFKEVINSAGDDELLELYLPRPGTLVVISYIDTETGQFDGRQVVLDEQNPSTIIPNGSRFELDATNSRSIVAYTCVIYGEKPLV